eukprot:gene9965-6957_t
MIPRAIWSRCTESFGCATSGLWQPKRRLTTAGVSTPPTTFQPNFTSLTNQVNRNEHYTKFGRRNTPMGVPRLSRLEMRPISILHETPRVIVAGRNYANGFRSNQFLLIHRPTNECIFIDASDDWPDDWITFLQSSRLIPRYVFLTHCHIDNIISLCPLLHLVKAEMGIDVGIMWNPAELPWVTAFPRCCERYGRHEEMHAPLPLLHNNVFTQPPPSQQAGRRPRIGRSSPGRTPTSATPYRPNDMLLTSATNRSSSFYEFGPHVPLHYICTPGHSPGHMLLSVVRERLLFSGDLLCYNHIGRVDLPYAAGDRLAESLLSLADFPDETVLLPGHGRLTTLGRERRHSQALRVLFARKRDQPQQEIHVGFNAGYL